MLLHTNIDRQNSVEVSPAPFTYTSTLNMAGMQIPAGSFLALKVYVSENMLMPFRFHSVRPDGKVMICDQRGALAGYWQTFMESDGEAAYISSILVDMQGVIMGHIACTRQTIDLIRRVVGSSLDTIFLDPNAFVFLPQCHVAMLEGYGKSIGIQSQTDDMQYHTGDLALAVVGGLARYSMNDSVSLSISNSKERLEQRASRNGIRNLIVNGHTVCCEDKSIVLKAVVESNLRVLMENNRIVLRGVLNA